MAYLVRLTARAQRDLAALYEHINAEHSAAALRWYQGLKQAILTLEELPKRCAVIRENKKLRQLLYGARPNVYRVIFRVLEARKQVDVIHIRHGARRGFRLR